jgi:excisionase family DNA binding protein
MAPQLLTTAEAATYLSLSPRTLESWRSQLRGPQYVKVSGKAIRYRPEDLEQWVNESIETGQP